METRESNPVKASEELAQYVRVGSLGEFFSTKNKAINKADFKLRETLQDIQSMLKSERQVILSVPVKAEFYIAEILKSKTPKKNYCHTIHTIELCVQDYMDLQTETVGYKYFVVLKFSAPASWTESGPKEMIRYLSMLSYRFDSRNWTWGHNMFFSDFGEFQSLEAIVMKFLAVIKEYR